MSGLVVQMLACNHWDLGSIPGPPKFHIIFLHMLVCSIPAKVHHMPQAISVSRVQSYRSDGQRMQTTMLRSQHRRRQSPKSNKAGFLMGLNSINTPNSGSYPPLGFAILFCHFIFYLSYFYFFPFINY